MWKKFRYQNFSFRFYEGIFVGKINKNYENS